MTVAMTIITVKRFPLKKAKIRADMMGGGINKQFRFYSQIEFNFAS